VYHVVIFSNSLLYLASLLSIRGAKPHSGIRVDFAAVIAVNMRWRAQSRRITMTSEFRTWDVAQYLRDNDDGIVSRLDEALRLHRRVKWYATMDIAFYRTTSNGEIHCTTGRFRLNLFVTSDVSELSADHMIGEFLRAIKNFSGLGSQWLVDYTLDFNIMLAPFRPAQGSCFIPAPQGLFRAGTHWNAVPVLFLITGTPFRSFSAYSCKI